MNEEGFVSFECGYCQAVIEASPDLIGTETECPACGQKLTVPDNRADGVARHGSDETSAGAASAEKGRTIRIELGDL